MGVSINWDQMQSRIVVLTYADEWTWREASNAFNNALAAVSQVQQPIALVFDLSDNTYFPSNGLVENIKSTVEKIHKYGNIAIVVVVMPKSSTRDMLTTAVQMYASKNCTYAFNSSLNEAYSTISQHLG